MRKTFIFTMLISTIFNSCGAKKTGDDKKMLSKGFVLGAFYDSTSPSTLNEDELRDLPKVVNLKNQITGAKHQANRATCTFFVTAALIEAAVKIDLKKEVNISEEYMNYSVKSRGHYKSLESSTVEVNTSVVSVSGIMLERDWSYQPAWFDLGFPCEKYKPTDGNAPDICFSHNPPNNFARQKIISTNGLSFGYIPKNTNNIIKFLANSKRPLSVEMPVNKRGWSDNGDVYYNENLRAECLKNPNECGYHAVVLTGYDMNKKVFFFKNSYGTLWGNTGFGTITFDTIDRYVIGRLYYAMANNLLQFPNDYNKDYLTLQKFETAYEIAADSINNKIDFKTNATNGRMLHISSDIVVNDIGTKISDSEAMHVSLTDQEKELIHADGLSALKVFTNTNDQNLDQTSDESTIVLTLPQAFNVGSFKSLINSKRYLPHIKTTISVHTDNQEFKILKQKYTPIQY